MAKFNSKFIVNVPYEKCMRSTCIDIFCWYNTNISQEFWTRFSSETEKNILRRLTIVMTEMGCILGSRKDESGTSARMLADRILRYRRECHARNWRCRDDRIKNWKYFYWSQGGNWSYSKAKDGHVKKEHCQPVLMKDFTRTMDMMKHCMWMRKIWNSGHWGLNMWMTTQLGHVIQERRNRTRTMFLWMSRPWTSLVLRLFTKDWRAIEHHVVWTNPPMVHRLNRVTWIAVNLNKNFQHQSRAVWVEAHAEEHVWIGKNNTSEVTLWNVFCIHKQCFNSQQYNGMLSFTIRFNATSFRETISM